ncbi:hypothetical protein ScPMuIL_007825 [Solemya velum]
MGELSLHVSNGKIFVWNAEDAATLREEHRIVGKLIGCLPRAPRQNVYLGLPLELLPEETSLLLDKGVAKLVDDSKSLQKPYPEQVQELERFRQIRYEQQIELCREARKKELYRNFNRVKEGKIAKHRKQLEEHQKAGETIDDSDLENVDVDIETIPSHGIPRLEKKHAMVQLFTETPWVDHSDASQPVPWTYPQTELEQLRCRVFTDLWEKGHFLTSGSKFGGDFLVYPGDPARFHSFYIARCLPHREQFTALDVVAMGRLGAHVRKTMLLCSLGDNNQIHYTSLQWSGMS